METKTCMITGMATSFLYCFALGSVFADTTINGDNHYAYGANVGWMDWRGDVANGVVISEYVCSGYIYAANIGWIHLGSGTPANGIHYQNDSNTDYGVNHDGLGNLRGFAYGANIGWINFEDTGNPKVDLGTGELSGFAYSANCGWISLNNWAAVVQTAVIQPGVDSDDDGISDAWELSYTNTLSALTATGDADGDGQTDFEESIADTNPLDPYDLFYITSYIRYADNYNELWWTSKPTRFYRVLHRTDLVSIDTWEKWPMGLLESLPGWNNVGFNSYNTNDFFCIQVVKPLSP